MSCLSRAGPVVPIDMSCGDVWRACLCMILSDAQVRQFMTDDGITDANKRDGYDHRIVLRFKVCVKQ